jgi:hypothetical protein
LSTLTAFALEVALRRSPVCCGNQLAPLPFIAVHCRPTPSFALPPSPARVIISFTLYLAAD